MWERWLPDFQWRPLRGGLCGIEEFEKNLDEIQLDKSHDGSCPLWIEMLDIARPGRARAEQCGPPHGQGVFFVVEVFACAIKHILLAWTGESSHCGVHTSRGAGSRRTRLGRRQPLAARLDPLAR